MERNAFAFVTQKLAASWLAMRLDVIGMLILTGTGQHDLNLFVVEASKYLYRT